MLGLREKQRDEENRNEMEKAQRTPSGKTADQRRTDTELAAGG